MKNKPVKLALIGAGNRGQGIFGQYALDMPHRATFIAVIEPDQAKREHFAEKHSVEDRFCFSSLEEFANADIDSIEGAIIATQEDQRLDPVKLCMEKNYHILVEKPLCRTPEALLEFYDSTVNYQNIIVVCHQMRLSPIFKTIKSLIDSGEYGKLVCVQHSENLSYHHMAHSFVRGFLSSSKLSSMLLSKSCHDLDIISHLVGSKTKQVSSFGSLSYFTKENCPEGAPQFCLEGCAHYQSCPYHVLKIYFDQDTDPAYIRQMGVNLDRNKLLDLMTESRFGKCVFQAGNDVVDHQSVIMNFENGVTASFTMCGHNGLDRRMTKLSLTNGEICYDGTSGTIKTWKFEPLREEEIRVSTKGTHGGGDAAIMNNFIDAILTDDQSILLTPISDSLEGHLAVFTAEESRQTGKTIETRRFEEMIRERVGK